MEPGSYETDTSGMAGAHGVVEEALEDGRRYATEGSGPHRVAAVAPAPAGADGAEEWSPIFQAFIADVRSWR